MEKLPLKLRNRFSFEILSKNFLYYTLRDMDGRLYHLQHLSKQEYLSYLELKKVASVEKSIYDFKEEDRYYLLFPCINKESEKEAIFQKMILLLEDIFKNFQFSVTLKKEYFTNLNNIYKVLDNRFSYFEMRIREIETSPVKNDISWVILSKYYILLDAKMYLYDLQQDIFSFIDKKMTVEYGLIFKEMSPNLYKNGKIEPRYSLYYGPIGMLFGRYYMVYDHLNAYDFFHEHLKKMDEFNQKYFCFMCLYIYILSVNLDVVVTPYNINNYLQATKKIHLFIKNFGGYAR